MFGLVEVRVQVETLVIMDVSQPTNRLDRQSLSLVVMMGYGELSTANLVLIKKIYRAIDHNGHKTTGLMGYSGISLHNHTTYTTYTTHYTSTVAKTCHDNKLQCHS